MSDFVIETRDLRKSYGGVAALNGLNLEVRRGSVYGFLGRNGAGKTTTIKILIGLIRSDSGEARVFGLPANGAQSLEIRRRTGFVTEDKDLYPYMTVEEMIRFTRSFFPKWRADLEKRYLEMFELPPRRKTEALSKGMRSKLMLLLAIARGAELLILDEPSDGLDPAGVEDILRELMALAAAEGTTIFFSSHQLHEVEQIADHICILAAGRTVIAGPLDDLKSQYQRIRVVLDRQLAEPVRWVDGAEHVQQDGRTVSILASRNIDGVLAQAQALPGASVERFPVTLKEIFLEHVRSH
ncbi:MAG TPA: ABC transporter ATP-binding protein [Bryobacteraceae bacterium]|jgi:ABC-2 type transport system ATP-binding protein|nr:ABC transporter ATP-binding protein [Bryobacteraceae bacterium]